MSPREPSSRVPSSTWVPAVLSLHLTPESSRPSLPAGLRARAVVAPEEPLLAYIYLLRHAPALVPTEAAPGSDLIRPLSEEGKALMTRAAAGMRRAGIAPGRILTSPYLRARQTAILVGEELGLSDAVAVLPELASGASWERVEDALRAFPGLPSVLLVGHQPDLSEMAASLLDGGPGVSFSPATLACLEVEAIPPLRPGSLVWCRRAEELEALKD